MLRAAGQRKAQQGPRGTGALTRARPRRGHDPQDQPRGEGMCPFPDGDTEARPPCPQPSLRREPSQVRASGDWGE